MTNEDKLREMLVRCRPYVAHLAHLRRDEGQNNDAMYTLMELDDVLAETEPPPKSSDVGSLDAEICDLYAKLQRAEADKMEAYAKAHGALDVEAANAAINHAREILGNEDPNSDES